MGGLIVLEELPRWPAPETVYGLTTREAWSEARRDLSYAPKNVWLTVARVYVESDAIANRAKSTPAPTAQDRQLIHQAQTTIGEAVAYLDSFREPVAWYRLDKLVQRRRTRRDALKTMEQERAREAEQAQAGLATRMRDDQGDKPDGRS
jgi:hypothetical protein